jgi:hypothetical protein
VFELIGLGPGVEEGILPGCGIINLRPNAAQSFEMLLLRLLLAFDVQQAIGSDYVPH